MGTEGWNTIARNSSSSSFGPFSTSQPAACGCEAIALSPSVPPIQETGGLENTFQRVLQTQEARMAIGLFYHAVTIFGQMTLGRRRDLSRASPAAHQVDDDHD